MIKEKRPQDWSAAEPLTALQESQVLSGEPLNAWCRERGEIMALVGEAIGAGARQDRACAAICLSHRTLQRWQRDQSRGDQRPVRLQASKNKLNPLERERLLAVANSAEFGHLPPARSFLVLRIAGDTSLLNRPFTASCAPKTRVSTAVPNGPHKSVTSRVRSAPRPQISCSVGTLRI